MEEKDLESWLCILLQEANESRGLLQELTIRDTSNDVSNMLDLLGEKGYEIIQDNSAWKPYPGLEKDYPAVLADVAGSMTPDIVLRSETTNQNRIYIEVKYHQHLNYQKSLAAKQTTRYLLHLLTTTVEKPSGEATDIRRAILLAAPEGWFKDRVNAKDWQYFLDHFRDLASDFGVTVGALWLPDKIVRVQVS